MSRVTAGVPKTVTPATRVRLSEVVVARTIAP